MSDEPYGGGTLKMPTIRGAIRDTDRAGGSARTVDRDLTQRDNFRDVSPRTRITRSMSVRRNPIRSKRGRGR